MIIVHFIIFCLSLLTPLIMLYCGRIFKEKAPREVNKKYGYRTDMSMKNEDTWHFAQKYIGAIWIKTGIVLFTCTIIILALTFNININSLGYVVVILISLQLICMLCTVVPVEVALRNTFDDNGVRKDKQGINQGK